MGRGAQPRLPAQLFPPPQVGEGVRGRGSLQPDGLLARGGRPRSRLARRCCQRRHDEPKASGAPGRGWADAGVGAAGAVARRSRARLATVAAISWPLAHPPRRGVPVIPATFPDILAPCPGLRANQGKKTLRGGLTKSITRRRLCMDTQALRRCECALIWPALPQPFLKPSCGNRAVLLWFGSYAVVTSSTAPRGSAVGGNPPAPDWMSRHRCILPAAHCARPA